MGYCPLSIRLGVQGTGGRWALGVLVLGVQAGAQEARAQAGAGSAGVGRAGGAQVRGARRSARGERLGVQLGARGTAGWAAWARSLGMLLGQWAVHLVHSACFDPV